MPELPEVECLTQAIYPIAMDRTIANVKFYRKDLREEVPTQRFNKIIKGQRVLNVSRRSKYMLLHTSTGVIIFHLGMTGNILCYSSSKPKHPHTHATFKLEKIGEPHVFLHFIDPRRFGLINCCRPEKLIDHRYFVHLGPEPLLQKSLGAYLHQIGKTRKIPIKSFIMNAKIVVGVGNIYASEALFSSRIHPLTPANRLTQAEYGQLGSSIKRILKKAIKSGGTTFRDFKDPNGKPGYFAVALNVYGKEGEQCKNCDSFITQTRISNRSTFFCGTCQTLKS